MTAGSPTQDIQRLFYDIPIRTLIKASDVSNDPITKIRGVAAIAKASATVTTTAAQKLKLRRCKLTAIGLHGSLS